MDKKNWLECLTRNRTSALIDGICIGIGFVFVVFGIVIPTILHAHNQIINGLLAIIGGILVVATGGIMEVYHWARLPLARGQDSEEKRWRFLFRCKNCGRKTGHALINTANPGRGKIEETFECQECGETKKIYELASMVEPENTTIRARAKGLEETQKNEPMEVTIRKRK